MKSLKPQPTSYKDFVQQIGQLTQLTQIKTIKSNKNLSSHKVVSSSSSNRNIGHVNHGNNYTVVQNGSHGMSITSMHSQSTSIWDKKSPSHRGMELSAQKRLKSHNQSIQTIQSKYSIPTTPVTNNNSNTNTNNPPTHTDTNNKTPTQPSLSKKDKLLTYHKFITETTKILTKILNQSQIPQLLNTRISYIQYLEALKALKMIYENYQPYPNDLVSELWMEYISGQNVGNFVISVAAILGLYCAQPGAGGAAVNGGGSAGKQNQIDRVLRKKYQSMRYTRMQLNKSTKQTTKQNQYTFMPQISERSRKLATQSSMSRSKKKTKKQKTYRQNQNYNQSTYPDQSLTQRINTSNLFHDKSKASIDYCCDQQFVPYTDNYINSSTNTTTNHYNNYPYSQIAQSNNVSQKRPLHNNTDYTGNKRSQLLYEKAKQKSCEKRENKTSNDIEYEKSKKQLTFKPVIIKSRGKDGGKDRGTDGGEISRTVQVKGEKNIISRMIRGRVQREVRKIINEKGVPYNEKLADKMRKQKYQQITQTSTFEHPQQTTPLTPSISLEQTLQPTSITPITRLTSTNNTNNQSEPKIEPFTKPSPPSTTIISEQDLTIDVYLSEDHKQKLLIKKGQNLQQIAIKFIEQHGICYEKKEQLIQLLEVSIRNALCPIDQLVEEEDQLASARTYNKKQHYR